MTPFSTTTMKWTLPKAGGALLLGSLSAACGGPFTASASDGGLSSDARGYDDGDGPADAGTTQDTAQADSGGAEDVAGGADSGSVGDTGSASDSAVGGGDSGGMADSGEGGPPTPSAVNLGAAGTYVILSKTGITNVPTSAITGNLGVSPAAATYITGFSLIADPSGVFSKSSQVTGNVYAADYGAPTPSSLTTAVSDMLSAFTDAAGRAPGVTELGAGNIGGMTLSPGVYSWSSAVLIPSTLTLVGGATDVWIFQIAQSLTLANATNIILTGGAVPRNVFWQVSGLVSLGTTAHGEGVILGETSIALQTGASINGRLLAQTAVTLASSRVVEPGP